MRYGWNPLKSNSGVAPPARVTAVVVNCIPELEGYFGEALAVLQLCLASMRAHADEDLDILVVDNVSCKPVRDFLLGELDAGRIQYLQLNARNVGVGNAMIQGLRAAPGQYIVYSDGDIYYREGWLRPHIAIAETFPDVGVIAGVPQRMLVDYHTGPTRAWASATAGVTVEEGDLLPEAWILELARSTGLIGATAAEKSDERFGKMLAKRDIRLSYRGQSAFVGGGHMQFLIPRTAIDRLPQRWTERFTRCKDELLDGPLAEAGLLRLATGEPLTYHIGNSIQEPWLRRELERFQIAAQTRFDRTGPSRLGDRIWQQRHVRRSMRKLYSWAFRRYLAGAPGAGTGSGPGRGVG